MSGRLVLLAPRGIQPSFGRITKDADQWNSLLLGAGRTRGSVYLSDGAIKPSDLGEFGEFLRPIDYRSWHLLSLTQTNQVASTLRLTSYPLCIARRRGRLPHLDDSLWRVSGGDWQRLAIERFLSSLQLNFRAPLSDFIIVGGWASNPAVGSQSSGAELALAAWAFMRMSQVAGGIALATARHDAYSQLVRTGALALGTSEPDQMYFDPSYGCRVGVLGFRRHAEKPGFVRIIDRMTRKLADCEVFTN